MLYRPLAGALLVAMALLSQPAFAGIHSLKLQNDFDGTEGFDSSDGPGRDSGQNNRIVRTNDIFRYALTITTSAHDKDIRVRIDLPPSASGLPVARWHALAPICDIARSSISPDGQRMECHVGDMRPGATQIVRFDGIVLPNVPNATRIEPPILEASSDQTAGMRPTAPGPDPLTVSAAPFYDVIVQPGYGPTVLNRGSGPNGEQGYGHRIMVGLAGRNPAGFGNKGVESLDPDVPVEIDLDISRFRNSVRVFNWSTPGTSNATGSFGDGCGSPGDGRPSTLAGTPAATARVMDLGPNRSTAVNAVLNGGDCRVVSSDRNIVRLAIDGINSSFAHVPTILTGGNQGNVPADEYWVTNKMLVLWTNLSDYPEGILQNQDITATTVRGRSLSGQPLEGDRPNNNTARQNLTNAAGSSSSKIFSHDQSTALPAAERTYRDQTTNTSNQVNQMAVGQSVATNLNYNNTGTGEHTNISVCEVIDRTAFDIAPHFHVLLSAQNARDPSVQVQYGTRPGSPYFASTDNSASEYGVTAPGSSEYSTASCAAPEIRWFNTWQEAEAAGGLVYVRIRKPTLAERGNISANVYGLRLRPTWAATIAVLGPNATTRVAGQPILPDTIIRSRAHIVSDTQPRIFARTTHIDHLRVSDNKTLSRLNKEIIHPPNVATAAVRAGSAVTYRLTPRFATTYPPVSSTVTISDVLPVGLQYVSGSSRVGGTAREPRLQADTPSRGMTTLTWSYPGQTPFVGLVTAEEAKLPAIEFQARVSQTLADGVTLRNHAVISGGQRDLEAECTWDAATSSFVASNGRASCAKNGMASFRVQSPSGFFVEKRSSRAEIEPGDPFDYTIAFISMGAPVSRPEIPEIIDILPFVGDGVANPGKQFAARTPASSFEPGAYRLESVTPPALDPNARILYTLRAPREIHNNPEDPSNRIPGGSTRWCQQQELGTPGCPATIGESTAVRIVPGIDLLPGSTEYAVTMNLTTDPVLTYPGNNFANHAVAGPYDPSARLDPVSSASDMRVHISMAMGSLSGRVFADVDQDGTFDPEDWPLPGQCVSISGTNFKNHAVRFSMRTDQDGNFRFLEATDNIHHGEDCSGTPQRHFAGLMRGTYTLSRHADTGIAHQVPAAAHAGNAGGTVTGQQIQNIALADADHADTYVFTDQPALPRLTLAGEITNDQEGQSSSKDLRLSAESSTSANGSKVSIAGFSAAPEVTNVPVPAGTYTLSTAALDGYNSGEWQCVINGRSPVGGNSVQLTYGDNAVCTIHHDDIPPLPRLTLLAEMDNDDGGTATAPQALLAVNSNGLNPAVSLSGTTGSAEVSAISLPVGNYTLSHAHLPGYNASWSCVLNGQPAITGNTLSLALSDKATCTLRYDDQPARLTLEKKLDIKHGRQATVGDFTLEAQHVDRADVRQSGVTGAPAVTGAEVPAGNYLLSESERPGFTAFPWVCRVQKPGSNDAMDVPVPGSTLNLGIGENAHCSVTNTDDPVQVKLDLISTFHVADGANRPVDDSTLPPVALTITSVETGASMTLARGESTGDAGQQDQRLELIVGRAYELRASLTPGYDTRLSCEAQAQQLNAQRVDAQDNHIRFVLPEAPISCRVERKRIPTRLDVTKILQGNVQPVAGSDTDHEVTYEIRVTHTGGAEGVYDLVDEPAFDPDVQILSHAISRNGNTLRVTSAPARWELATQQPIPIGNTDTYQVKLRIRVPQGSNSANNACTGNPGNGLYNRVSLNTRNDSATGSTNTGDNQLLHANACANTPESRHQAQLLLEKRAVTRSAEVGDLITYRLRIRNQGKGPALSPVVVDTLPRGFRFEPGSLRVENARQVSVKTGSGREMHLTLNRIDPTGSDGQEVLITYRARVGVGSQEGDGINRAQIRCPKPNGSDLEDCSNESRWKVTVNSGVFSEEACLTGQIFVDCNGNSVKDRQEPGIPGVRLYLQNGTWMVSDAQGKYSHCGLRPRTHVLKVDGRTLPHRARMVTSSSHNSGDALSLFVDARKGMLHRADFIEGSCSATVMAQVKARQQQEDTEDAKEAQADYVPPALLLDSRRR
ncbi:MAG: hypothetical protein Q4D19_02055 [Lautropia sp.]|nr:hypothetical protein [Lautropia sp.]